MDNVHASYHYCHDGIECKDAMRAMMGEQVGYSAMLYVWWGFAFKYMAMVAQEWDRGLAQG